MVKISEDICIGCGNCVDICPTNAIMMINEKAKVNEDYCTECYVCLRARICKAKAIRRQELEWPRIIRNPFSDVVATHKTGIAGRGTEEMKTTDVTNRYDYEEIGFSIEVGRPGVGCNLRDIEKFTIPLSKIGVEFEQQSPITELLIDEIGHIREDVKNERVLSAIIEFKIHSNDKITQILKVIEELDTNLETVFSVGIVSRYSDNNKIPVLDILSNEGYDVRPNSKINIGLGRLEVE